MMDTVNGGTMVLKRYKKVFERRKQLSRRCIYIYLAIGLITANAITLCIFQTNLRTKRQEEVIRHWGETTKADNLDGSSVKFSNIDQHRETYIGKMSIENKGNTKGNADRRQLGHKKVKHTDEYKLMFENHLQMLQDKQKKEDLNSKLDLKNNNKAIHSIRSGIENREKIQEDSIKTPHNNVVDEDKIEQARHDSKIGYHIDKLEVKAKQYLNDSLSPFVAKFDNKGVKIASPQRVFTDTDKGNSTHFPAFHPNLYPQKIDISEILNNFSMTGVIQEHHVINKWVLHHLINPTNVCGETGFHSKVFLLFIVKTKPDNFVKRECIRETWANQIQFLNIRTVFSVGVTQSSSVMKDLIKESMKYKDVLLMDFKDSYYNLTLKTINNINWAVKHCSMADYVVLMDDDMYLATDLLIKYLQELPRTESERLYMGYVQRKALPVRKETSDKNNKKWIVSENEYPFRNYPHYVFGGCIIMAMKTVVQMHTIIPYIKTFSMEDVYVGILASKLGIIPRHTNLINIQQTYIGSVRFKTFIASHCFDSPDLMRQAWECHSSFVDNCVKKAVFCS